MKWFAFNVPSQTTMPVKEDRQFGIVEILKRRGFAAHVPYEVKHYRRYGQKNRSTLKYAALPSYCLMAFDGCPPWNELFDLACIRSVVKGAGGQPYIIPHANVQALFALAAKPVPTRSLNKGFKSGDDALVRYGALAGHHVKVQSVRGERVRALLGLLGSEREVELKLGQLEAA